jgi:hypothetical protein
MPPAAIPKLVILAAALLLAFTAPPARADAEISVTQSYISKDRVDVGTQITVGYRLVWTSTRSPVTGATVTVDGHTCSDWGNGWYMITDTSTELAYRHYTIGSVRSGGALRSFQMDCETETCVFDKVIINMYPEYERVNVGEEPPIVWYAYYAFNFEIFKGEVIFNHTGPYTKVGKHGITVDYITDPVNGIHSFEADTVKITWDTIVIQLYSDKRRYDVGEEASISYTAHYKYDTKPFIGTVELNNTLTKGEVGKYRFTVKSIDDERNGVTAFTCNVVEAIYDKIIVELETLDERINVGEAAPLVYRAHHAYDGQEFSGNIYFNPILLETPGSANVRVVRVSDMVYFLSAFEANTVPMIWDQVQVDLRVEDDRVDLGESVDVEVSAHYAYDGQPLDPSMVRLNALSHSMDAVGDFTFEATGIEPGGHDITSVSYNKCKVIWDQVALEVESPSERVILGTKSSPEVNAYYSYDHKPFTGSYRLDKEFSSDLGSETYKVIEVTDNLYGLRGFTCSEGTYYFDSVEVEHTENQLIPGMVQVTLTLRYRTDGSPVNGAEVVVNGEPCTYQGNGVYSASLTSLLPMTSLESLVQVDDNVVERIKATTPMVGNIVVIAAALLVVVLVLFRLRR